MGAREEHDVDGKHIVNGSRIKTGVRGLDAVLPCCCDIALLYGTIYANPKYAMRNCDALMDQPPVPLRRVEK